MSAPVLVASGSQNAAGVQTTITISSVTVSAGQSLVAGWGRSGTESLSGVSWNTSEAFTVCSGSTHIAVLTNPTAGTHDIVLTLGAAGRGSAWYLIVSNLDQTTPTRTGSAASNAVTVSPVSAVGDLVVGCVSSGFGDTNNYPPTTPSDTLAMLANTGTGSACIRSRVGVLAGSATSTAMTWGHSPNDFNATPRVEAVALIGATVTTNTFYLLDTTASSSSHGQLQIDGSAPTSAATGTGWTVGSTAADNYSLLAYGTERAASTFAGTALPSGAPGTTDCWRSASTITGQYAAGDWDFSFALRAVDQGGTQDGAIRVRLWRSTDPTGSGATEITSGATQLSTMTNIATGSDSTSTGTITLGAVTLEAEYLFVQVAYRITGAA